MTVEPALLPQVHIVQGTGPYAIGGPYAAGAVRAAVILNGARSELAPGADFTVLPSSSETTGNLTLAAGIATAFAGGQLHIRRDIVAEQGWVGVGGEREKGLEAQLDLLTMRIQDLDRLVAGALRVDDLLSAFVPVAGASVVFGPDGQPAAGPSVATITGAVAAAAAAAASATAAAASAAAAEAAENTILKPRGQWLTATAYQVGDLVHEAGSQYEVTIDHAAGSFAVDLAAGRLRIFVSKGATGAGSGDVLAANAGSEYAPVASTFRNNLALPVSPTTKFTGEDVLAKAYDRGGFWNVGATNTNMPAGGADGDHLIVKRVDDNNLVLIWLFANGKIATNKRAAGVWTGWIMQATEAFVAAAIAASEQIIHVRDEKPSGTNGGTFTTGSYVTRALNTVKTNTIPGAALAANRITLPAGIYEIAASAPAQAVNLHKALLYNVTDGAATIMGTSAYAASSYGGHSRSEVRGRFTIAGAKDFEIRHGCQTTLATIGLGAAASFGDVEVYTDVMIRRIS